MNASNAIYMFLLNSYTIFIHFFSTKIVVTSGKLKARVLINVFGRDIFCAVDFPFLRNARFIFACHVYFFEKATRENKIITPTIFQKWNGFFQVVP